MRLIPKKKFKTEIKGNPDKVCSLLRKATVKTRFGKPTESRNGKLFMGQIDRDFFHIQHSGYIPGQEKYNKSIFAPIVFGNLKPDKNRTVVEVRMTLSTVVRMVFLLWTLLSGNLLYMIYAVKGLHLLCIVPALLLVLGFVSVRAGFAMGIKETNAYLEEVLGVSLE